MGDPLASRVTCPSTRWVDNPDDCDDADAAVGAGDPWYHDSDGDLHGDPTQESLVCPGVNPGADAVMLADDCDDGDAAISPEATEICDGIDDDCDGLVDDADDSVEDGAVWYLDDDGDGYGDAATQLTACVPPADSVTNGDDCDDLDGAISPGAEEICNEIDDNCDDAIDADDDDLVDGTLWYLDSDDDGYGVSTGPVNACTQPSGYSSEPGDCDDASDAISPDATEVCNDADDDCDSLVDGQDPSVSGATVWYLDADRDGFGAAGAYQSACSRPTGYVDDSSDCDDGAASVNPDATEIGGNGIDEDCDGSDWGRFIDEQFEAGTAGSAIAGNGCWTCFDGGCDETFSADLAHAGVQSLYTPGTTAASLYCGADGFGADFELSAWFYDDGSSSGSGPEFRLSFEAAARDVTGAPALFVGFSETLCDSGHYCVGTSGMASSSLADLGERAEGWHEITASVGYTSTDAADWAVCIDAECTATPVETTDLTVAAFRLQHANHTAFLDEVTALPL